MPNYIYRCKNCGLCKEVSHSMSEVDEPSEELLKEITCNEVSCLADEDTFMSDIVPGTVMNRVPQTFMTPGDLLINNKSKRDKFQKERQKRSRKDFKENVLPGLTGGERKKHMERLGYKDK